MNIQFQIYSICLLFLLSVPSGMLLSRKGRPFKKGLFTVHKLTAIAYIILSAITLYNIQQTIIYTAGFYLLIISIIFILIVLCTGILLSFDKFSTGALQMIHKITPLPTIFFILSAIYFTYSAK